MLELFEKAKQWVCSRWENTLKALKVDFSLGIDFQFHITKKTA